MHRDIAMYRSLKLIFSKRSLYDNDIQDKDIKEKLKFQIKGEKDIEANGINGPLIFYLPNDQGNGQREVHIQGQLGPQAVRQICRTINYAEGILLRDVPFSSDENISTYHLDPSDNDHKEYCMKIFSAILEEKDINEDQFSKIDDYCVSNNGKQHIHIECNKPFDATISLAAQNACGNGDTCPTGFSRRKSLAENNLDSEQSEFCLPNRCFCENGLAVTSSYDEMGKICGVRKEDEGGVGSHMDNTDSRDKLRINNGQKAEQVDFPFQCQLYRNRQTNTDPFCSASILSPLYLLTAGHCFVDQSQKKTLAKVYALVESQTDGQIPSEKIVVHENYYASDSNQETGFILNDIALVYLSEAILFNDNYRPICIYDAFMNPEEMRNQDLIIGRGGEDTRPKKAGKIMDPYICA